MIRKIAAAAFAATAGIALGAGTGHATVVTYNSQAAFNAATTGLTTYLIPAPASGTYQPVSSPFTIGPRAADRGRHGEMAAVEKRLRAIRRDRASRCAAQAARGGSAP